MKLETRDEFIAVLFLRNANYTRFGSMLTDYRKLFANNDDKYPKDLKCMMDVMQKTTRVEEETW